MKRTLFSAALMALATATLGVAQLVTNASPATSDLMKSLPPGDAVLTVNVDALVNRAVPAWFAGDAEAARRVEERLAKAQLETGIDPRKVRDLAMSMRLGGTEGADFAAILTGTFDPARIGEALKASKGGAGARTEVYGGVTIQSFSAKLNAPGAPAGATDLAVAVLDPGTLLVGSVKSVRAAIDARTGKGPNVLSNTELIAAYEESGASSVGRFALKMPEETVKAELARDPNNVALQNFVLIKSVFGSLDVSSGAAMRTIARTHDATEAKTVSGSLLSLKELAKMFVGGNATLSDLANRAAITTQGADVLLTLDVPASMVPAVFNSFQKPEAPKPMAVVGNQ
jgi:hypothetical protein